MSNGWNKSDVNTIRLQNAVLCADCEIISDSPHDTCEVCGSRSLASLALILGGPLPVQRTRLVETAVPQTVVVTPFPVLDRPPRKRHRRRKAAA